MSHMIRVSTQIYKRLEQHAQGFDTPANVIQRLLDHYEGIDGNNAINEMVAAEHSSKDYTKFVFNGVSYGKGRLVHAVVKEYVEKHPNISLDDLIEAFPSHLQGSIGVIAKRDDAIAIHEQTGHKRHFLKKNEIISLSDYTIAVSREWGKGNINNFIDQATSLGLEIKPVSG